MLKQLLVRESQQDLSRKLKFVFKAKGGGVKFIEVQSLSGDWTIQASKDNIEAGCIEENIRRFTQTNHTPSLQQQQIELLGWTGNTAISQALLSGHVEPNLHPDIRKLAHQLTTPQTIQHSQPIPIYISSAEYIQSWKHCRELTSSGKSNLLFGHFKASCKNTNLMEVDRILAEIPFRTGYSLSRWQWAIDVMIPKKSDSLRLDKLRTIVLMEADFNFLNKIIGGRVMAHAEQCGTIAPEQYGSRKKVLFYMPQINR
jgi:hypothetical protein